MRKNYWKKFLVLILVVVTGIISTTQAEPKNVIFFIGDGMGFEQVYAARCYLGVESLPFEEFPNTAECTTYSANNSITDSAAAGTALATGFKVNNGVVSMAYPGDGSELLTLLEEAQANGKSVGLISTCYLTHATPACFGAHEPSRNNLSNIANDYLTQTLPNVLFGGGGNGLTVTATQGADYIVVTDTSGFDGLDTSWYRISAQFGSTHMPYKYDYLGLEYPYPFLNEMVQKALEALEYNENGFFLMVEGGRIDQACHDNNLQRCIHETIDFFDSVQVVIDWAAGRTDTLIIVTADHETGGLDVVQDNGAGQYPDVTWSSGGHTGTNVPVYAWGQNAELVTGVMDNTDMFFVCTADTSVPQATNPDPKDGATNVALDAPLTWNSGTGATYHNVYMGTNSENLLEVAHQITETEYYNGPWDANTLYYWRIDEEDSSGGIVEGELWRFTTTYDPEPISNPYPADGAENVVLDVQLSWDAGARVVIHKVYFGEESGNLSLVSEQTATTYSPQNLSNSTPYYWKVVEWNTAGSTESPEYSFTTESVPAPVKVYATGENTVKGIVINGNYLDTQASDDSYEILQEVMNVPNKNGYSTLVHTWTFNVESSSSAEFYVEAHHSPSSDGDDFIFSYSTDGETYNEMVTVTKTEDTDAPQVYTFPSGLSGIVYVKVTDSDHTKKNLPLDILYVDQIYILASSGTIKHYLASNPSPVDGATDIPLDIDIILSWDAGDDAESHVVRFCPDREDLDLDESLLETLGKDTTTLNLINYYHDIYQLTTYYWRIDEIRDGGVVATGDVWSFTTTFEGQCIPTDLMVDSVVTDTVRADKGQEYGRATVTIVDNCGNLVSGATVTGSFVGDFTESMTGDTNLSGVVIFQTTEKMKKPSFGFIVENVVLSEPE